MVEATATLTTDKAVRLFEKFAIFTKAELESREEILYETYAKSINIEALTMIDMATKQFIPAVVKYTTTLANSLSAVRNACEEADTSVQKELLIEVSARLAEAKAALGRLNDVTAQAAAQVCAKEKAFAYKDMVFPAMDALRKPIDQLEMLVDKEAWPVPSYGDLMFGV